jgi:hypothetical protein
MPPRQKGGLIGRQQNRAFPDAVMALTKVG